MIDFISNSTVEVAKNLLGKKLLIEKDGKMVGGLIVETEAYIGASDMACHTYNYRKTPKVESMYLSGGTIYIYAMHGHNMLNLVTRDANQPEAVLIRAIEPTDGTTYMSQRRPVEGVGLTNGPGKLTKAMGITRILDGEHITKSSLSIDYITSRIPKEIKHSPRIGIPNKGEWTDKLLRFYVAGNPYVTGIRKRETLPINETWI